MLIFKTISRQKCQYSDRIAIIDGISDEYTAYLKLYVNLKVGSYKISFLSNSCMFNSKFKRTFIRYSNDWIGLCLFLSKQQ